MTEKTFVDICNEIALVLKDVGFHVEKWKCCETEKPERVAKKYYVRQKEPWANVSKVQVVFFSALTNNWSDRESLHFHNNLNKFEYIECLDND